MVQAVSRWPLTAKDRVLFPVDSVWNLWWKNWHWDRYFSEYFGFPLLVSFHRRSTTRKNEKLIISITGVHNDCCASVASAAGPFTSEKRKSVKILHNHKLPRDA
jgi:hypothetical protein